MLNDLIQQELNKDNITFEYRYWLEGVSGYLKSYVYANDRQFTETIKEVIASKTLVNGVLKYNHVKSA